MHLFTAFHINLHYSSIPSVHYGWVLDNCYWPILDLCETLNVKTGLEFSGQTLRKLLDLDPLFIKKIKELTKKELIEPICGAEYQSIGPLMPLEDNLFNYMRGRKSFKDIFGWYPKLLYLPEQTISRGLIDPIVKSGFNSVLIEWNNINRYAYPHLRKDLLFGSPITMDSKNNPVRLLWNHSVIFQKIQRLFSEI